MIIKQQINHGAIWKYVTCIMAFFIPFYSPVSHFVNFTLSTLLCYSLKIINYGMRENKNWKIWKTVRIMFSDLQIGYFYPGVNA